MTDFGFSLSPSSTTNLDRADRSLYKQLEALEPDLRLCMSCGSCAASCTAAAFGGMNLRRVILDLDRGRDVAPLLSACMLCGKCTMVCPRGINTRGLILRLSQIYKQP